MHRLVISTGAFSVEAELLSTPTTREMLKAMPIEGITHLWGEEIYFRVPVQVGLEPDAKADLAVGDLAYWPDGPAFCIFFGPTPASSNGEPRAYSPVNIFGRIPGDISLLKEVPSGQRIKVRLVPH